jgi:hypothetical protein
MRRQEILSYLAKLNNGKAEDTIFKRAIGPYVELARVWSISRGRPSGYVGEFFFIKNHDGVYVGAVYDMQQDLHWFVLKRHRKQGHLTKALRTVILPYLFSSGREMQRITIAVDDIGEENYAASKAVAIALRFEATSRLQDEFILHASNFDHSNSELAGHVSGLSEHRVAELGRKVALIQEALTKIRDEVLMSYMEDDGLSDVTEEVGRYRWKIEDLMWKHKGG